MNIYTVMQGIRTRALADTAAGGLFPASNPLLTGWYFGQAPEAATYAYVTVTLADDGQSDTFDKSGRELALYFHIYATMRDNNGSADAYAISARIFGNGNPNSPTYGFHRWQTTLPSGSGMVSTIMARQGGTDQSDLNVAHLIETYTLTVSQE